MKKPNFFIVGAPKCGTSSLHYYLNQHPDIYLSERKEPQYFCEDFHKESDGFHLDKKFFLIRTEKEYLQLFKKADKEKIIGESTSKYMYSKVAAENIYQFNPEAKILLSIREPVDFLFSYHSQCLFDLVENEKDLQSALNMEKSRKQGENIPPDTHAPSFAFYSEISQFSTQIHRYKSVFPESQIKIILFDDFRSNPEKIYREILSFLNVDDFFSIKFDMKNPNKIIRHQKLHNFFYSPVYSGVRNFFKSFLGKNARKKIKKMSISYQKRPKYSEDFIMSLKKEYINEVTVLSNILNRDLIDLWGYKHL